MIAVSKTSGKFAVTPKKKKGKEKKNVTNNPECLIPVAETVSKCMHEFRVHAWYGEFKKIVTML